MEHLLIEENLKLMPLMFVGYIDPSAGQVFSSMGPVVLSAIGGAVGMGVVFLVKVKNRIFSIFKGGLKSDYGVARDEIKQSRMTNKNEEENEEDSDLGD